MKVRTWKSKYRAEMLLLLTLIYEIRKYRAGNLSYETRKSLRCIEVSFVAKRHSGCKAGGPINSGPRFHLISVTRRPSHSWSSTVGNKFDKFCASLGETGDDRKAFLLDSAPHSNWRLLKVFPELVHAFSDIS